MSNMLSLKLPCLTIVFKTMEGFSIIAKPTMTFLLSFLPQVRLMALFWLEGNHSAQQSANLDNYVMPEKKKNFESLRL